MGLPLPLRKNVNLDCENLGLPLPDPPLRVHLLQLGRHLVGTGILKDYRVAASVDRTLGVERMERHYRTWIEALGGWDGGSGDGGGGVEGSPCSEEGG